MNYYNEFDKNAAEWLRQLIGMGAIPKGEVDERSITDVTAGDLRGFTQCHFFAGIGGWPEALRRAGVPSTRPLWTGSCPCQAFSCAGKQQGFEDPRDLWPHFFRLIRECRPERVFGEQVSAAIGHGWLDRLSADMEAEGYAVGAVILGAHSAGADHQRQRLYWVADAEDGRLGADRSAQREAGHTAQRVSVVGMGNAALDGCEMRNGLHGELHRKGSGEGRISCGMENPSCVGRRRRCDGDQAGHGGPLQADGSGGACGMADTIGERGCCWETRCEDAADAGKSGQARNFWSAAVAIPCRDNCFRRAQRGIFPLVAKFRRDMGRGGDSRLPSPDDIVTVETANQTGEARVMRLKGYGNAICVETARRFIEACEDVLGAKGEC